MDHMILKSKMTLLIKRRPILQTNAIKINKDKVYAPTKQNKVFAYNQQSETFQKF